MFDGHSGPGTAIQDLTILTRQVILAAAAGVFAECGYQPATTSEILARAGAAQGARYFLFPPKRGLTRGGIREQNGQLLSAGHQFAVQQPVDILVPSRPPTARRPNSPGRCATRSTSRPRNSTAAIPSSVGARSTPVFWSRGRSEADWCYPHVVPAVTASALVRAFTGVHATSRFLYGYQDLPHQVTGLLRHALPSDAVPQRRPRRPLTPGSRNSCATPLA